MELSLLRPLEKQIMGMIAKDKVCAGATFSFQKIVIIQLNELQGTTADDFWDMPEFIQNFKENVMHHEHLELLVAWPVWGMFQPQLKQFSPDQTTHLHSSDSYILRVCCTSASYSYRAWWTWWCFMSHIICVTFSGFRIPSSLNLEFDSGRAS